MKKLLTLFTLLICICSGAWAQTTYRLIDRSGANPVINSTDFKGAVASSYLKDSYGTKTFDETTELAKYVQLGGTSSSTSNLYDAKKFIAYDVKTTSTTFKVYVWNGNNANQNLYYSYIKEGETTEPSGRKETKAVTTKEAAPESFEFTVSGSENKTVVFYVASTNVVFYQIEAIESGTTLKTGGERGYNVNLNKGRLAATSGTASLLEGIEYCTSSNYGFINKTAVEISTKGTNYVKFTTTQTTKATITVSSSNTYYIATAKDPESTDIIATNTATSSTTLSAGTYYIVPNGSKVSVTGLAFAIPDAPGAISFSPAGGTVSVGEEITLTSTGSDVIKYKWSSAAIDSEGDWSSAETYAADNKPTTPSVGDENNVLSVWASNDGGNTYGSATYTVEENEAPSKPVITGAPVSAVEKGESVTLTAASATGNPAPTYEWFQCDNEEKGSPVSKATTATYSPSTTAAGTYYFYAVASNSEGSVASDVVTIVVNKSTECKALQVVYSNGFDAFITHPVAETYYVAEDEEVIAGTKNVGDIKTTATNGRVVAYYVAGSSVPTISSTTLSDDATYNVVGTTLTVTAEDGTTTGVYDISLTAVEPYLGGDITFDGTESWVKAPYGFIDTKGYKYQRLKRDNENTDPWDRLTPGNTRIYMFLGANTSVTLKTTSSNGNVDVKVNTITVKNNQAWGDGKAIEVTNDLNAPYLLGIYSHQTSGDNYVSSIEITKPTTVSGTISEAGWSTFSSNYALDLSTITGGAAYVATTNDNTEVTLTETSAKVAAGTGLMIKGTEGEPFTIGVTSDAATLTRDNLLVGLPNGGTVAANDYNYVFAWTTGSVSTAGFWYVNDAEPTLGAGKAYLHSVGSNGAKLNIVIGETPSQEETDGIKSVQGSRFTVNGEAYNLAGQKVGADYKGIVIVNGKKVIRK